MRAHRNWSNQCLQLVNQFCTLGETGRPRCARQPPMFAQRATLTLKSHSLSDSMPVPAGTSGVLFVTAGTCAITTAAGDAVTIAGVVGTFIDTGLLRLLRTGGTATVLAWVPLT